VDATRTEAAVEAGFEGMARLVTEVLGAEAWHWMVSNAPNEWEEAHALREIAGVLRHPSTSPLVWLLLPKGAAAAGGGGPPPPPLDVGEDSPPAKGDHDGPAGPPAVAWRKKWTEGTVAACGVEATSVVVATEAAKAGQAAREEAARVGAAAAKTEVVTSSAAVAS